MEQRSAFHKKHRAELERLLKTFEEELLEDVAPFWTQRVEDRQYGGYLTCFDREGVLTDTRKPGWFVGRTLYTFSLLCNAMGPRPEWLHLAQVGRDVLDTPFSRGDGRFNQMMSREGKVLEGFTSIFTDHFAVKGLYEYMEAAGKAADPAERALARRWTDRLFKDVQDPEVLRMEGVPAGMRKHAINFMTLAVALESHKIFENDYNDVLRQCVHRSLYEFASDAYEAPFEYVQANGEPRLEGVGRIIDPGHTMESLWFSIHAADRTGDTGDIARASAILDWVLARAYDKEYGGFYQHVDVDGRVPPDSWRTTRYGPYTADWTDKIWWVQAEGLYTLAASALYTENERHWRYFLAMADYVQSAFRDRKYGEWFAILHRDGSLLADCKGFELKGPYHVPRCLVNLCVLLRRYLAGELPATPLCSTGSGN